MTNRLITLSNLEHIFNYLENNPGAAAQDLGRIQGDPEGIRRIAKLFDGGILDRSDLFKAAILAPKLFEEPAKAQERIRFFLGYRVNSGLQEELTRSFESLEVKDGRITRSDGSSITLPESIGGLADFSSMQVGITRFTPKNPNPELPPLIFMAGLDHPASIYPEFFDRLARDSRQELLVVDALGNGGSTIEGRKAVTHKHLVASMLSAILACADTSKGFQLGGFSLGSVPARAYLDLQETFERETNLKLAGKPWIIHPVPSRSDTLHGLTINPDFIRGVLVDAAFNGGMLIREDQGDLFCKNPSADNATDSCFDILRKASRESYPSHLLSPLTYTYAMLQKSALNLADEGRITLVLGGEDNLFPLENGTLLAGHPHIFILPEAHHSQIAKSHIKHEEMAFYAQTLKESRKAPISRQPTLPMDDLYRQPRTKWQTGILGDGQQTGVHVRFSLEHGLNDMGSAGFGLGYYASLISGYAYEPSAFALSQETGLDLSLDLFNLPLTLGIGGRHNIEFFTHFDDAETNFSASPYAFINWELIQSLDLRVEIPLGDYSYHGSAGSPRGWQWNYGIPRVGLGLSW